MQCLQYSLSSVALDIRHRRCYTAVLQQGFQAGVEVIDPGQEVQHPFVYAQARIRQAGFFDNLNQAPAAQGAYRTECTPMRFFQRRQRQTECRIGSLGIALRCGAQRGKFCVQLHACAKQENVSLKKAETEAIHQAIYG